MSERHPLVARASFELARALMCLPPKAQIALSGKPQVRIDGLRLEPQMQLLIALMDRFGIAELGSQPAAEMRVEMRGEMIANNGPPLPVGRVRDLLVDGGAAPIPARSYAPDEPGPHPLLVFSHGGGFVFGDVDTHDAACRLLCRHAGVHVLSLHYRLSPEHKAPAAVDDARAALRWAFAHASELGVDPSRIGVGGDSAGGNLSAVVSQLATHDGGPAPAFQLLVYPPTDRTTAYPSQDLFAEGLVLTRKSVAWFHEQYTSGSGIDRADPRFSPLRAKDLSGLPPAFVVTAGFDPLRDEGEAYARALKAAGNEVVLRRFDGLVHGFLSFGALSPVARDAIVEIAGALRALAWR